VKNQYSWVKNQLRLDNLIFLIGNKKRHLNNLINNKDIFKNSDYNVDEKKFDYLID